MSEFKTKIEEFFENLIAEDKADGFACEMMCRVSASEPGQDPVDITDDESSMEDVNAYFGANSISLNAIPVERDAGGSGEHELVLEFGDTSSSEVVFVLISFENTATDFDGDSFETEFLDFEFVKPVTREVTVFEREDGASSVPLRSLVHLKTPETATTRAVPSMEEIEAFRAARSPRWNTAFDALRDFRLSNIVDEDGNGYPVIDLLTREGVSISDGEMELINLVDEMMLALYPRPSSN